MGVIYLVIENEPGYMPETEPVEFEDRAGAEAYMKQVRQEWMEDLGASPFEITGSYKDQYWLRSDRVVEIVEVST